MLKDIIEKQPLSVTYICKKSGIPRPTLYTLYEKEKVEQQYLNKLSFLWDNNPQSLDKSDNGKPIPYYNADVLAGKIDILRDNATEYIKGYYILPGVKDATGVVTVAGDSMYPAFKRGDRIVVKYIKDKSLIEYGQAYVIVTTENTIIKFIRKSKLKDHWLLCSKNEEFDDYDIPIEKVINVFLVKEIIRAENL